jgi:hypothetical protein
MAKLGNMISGGLSGAAGGAEIGSMFGGPGIGTAVGAGLGILGGFLMDGGGGDEDEQRRLMEEALSIIDQVPDMDPTKLKVVLEKYKEAGLYTPALEQAVQQQASQLQNYKQDQTLKAAQMSALDKLGQVGQQGLTAQDMQRIEDTQRQLQSQAQANQQSAIMQRQQRGIGGSGDELAAQLMAGQASADQARQQGNAISSQANQRALDAIMNRANMASSMENQNFSQKSQIAAAQDAINRFNASQRADVQARNVNSANNAQYSNLKNKQDIMNANTGVANQQALLGRDNYLKAYDAAVNKATSRANVRTGQAASYGKLAEQGNQSVSQVLQGIPEAASGLAKAYKGFGAPSGQNAPEEPKEEIVGNKKYLKPNTR